MRREKLIPISFATLFQTLKSDPELVKLIYNMPAANTGYKDNSNNITKYIGGNKHVILGLTEKQYENLVEALTNNVIDTVTSSSNPTLLLP